MKTVTATPIEIAILRRSEKGESFSHIAEQPEIIEMLGEKYATPSQRVEKLKRMADRADWHRFQLRRKGLELPEALPRLAEAPQPIIHALDSLAESQTPTLADESTTPSPTEEPSKFRKWAELLKSPTPPKAGPMEGARNVFAFPSGAHFEAADAPKNPGGPVGVHYNPGLKCWTDSDNQPVRVYYVDRGGFKGEVLHIVDSRHAEWRS